VITCREVLDLLCDFVAGDLAPEKHGHVQQHLHACPPCLAYCNSYRITIRLARQLPCSPPPPDVAQRLRAALETGMKVPPPRPPGPIGPGLSAP
jgi:anti-sigma factor RsiW